VMQLLNHTAGLDWRLVADTGDGDDALAGQVARLPGLELVAPPGSRASYSQVGYNLAGRIIENVTGWTFERAVARLLLDPLGLPDSFFLPDDVLTRRFAVGHNLGDDGTPVVARQWRDTRANNPGGGLASSVTDLLRWARFHLGDGRAADGTTVLPEELLHRMRLPTVELRSSTLGDALGICWFLRDVDGVATIGHCGSANGQFAELLIAPGRDFAVVTMSNSGPDNGLGFNQAVVRFALEHYLGVVERDPEPLAYDPRRAREIAGSYENEAMTLTIASDGARLTIAAGIKPEIRAASDAELPADLPAADLGLLPGDADEYIVTSGGLAGQRGFFTRDASGAIAAADAAGRLFKRVPASTASPDSPGTSALAASGRAVQMRGVVEAADDPEFAGDHQTRD
jgi:CubicO group peptidase (beta-lactamase class C family)